MRCISYRILRKLTLACACLAVVAIAGVRVVAQDAPGERRRFNWETRVTKTAETYGVPDLMRTWAVTKRENPVNAAICDKHTDSRALPRNPCRFNADLLTPPFYAAWSTPIIHDSLTRLRTNAKGRCLWSHRGQDSALNGGKA